MMIRTKPHTTTQYKHYMQDAWQLLKQYTTRGHFRHSTHEWK